MATSAPRLTPGSAGTVDTQFLPLPRPLELDCGRTLHPIRVAYEVYGTLAPARDNVILVCHALSGDAHAAGIARTPPDESTRDGFGADERDRTSTRGLGWWDGMIGPGKAFDTDRFFVVSSNLLGGCRGTTGPSSVAAGLTLRGFSSSSRKSTLYKALVVPEFCMTQVRPLSVEASITPLSPTIHACELPL